MVQAVHWKQLLLGFCILLLAPALVLVAFALWTQSVNARPQPGPFKTGVWRQVVFPWQETAYTFSFDAAPGGPPPPPLDIALLVDVSGSMTRSLPTMAAAAGQLAREILTSRPNDVRLAVIRFDTEAEVNASWTSDLRQVEAGLNNLKPWTQQTNPHRAFEEIDRLMALPPAKPSAKRVIIFYTDGALAECPPETCPAARCPKKTWSWRRAGCGHRASRSTR